MPENEESLMMAIELERLDENSVVKEYLTTATDGKKYQTKLYNMEASGQELECE